MKKINYLFLIAVFLLCKTISVAQPVVGITTFFTNTTTALQANTACSVTKTVSVSGWSLSIQSTSNCGFNWTNSTGGDGRIQYLAGFGTASQLTFGSSTGSEFALQYLIWGVSTSSWTSKPMTFVGYKNGLPVPGATLNATTPSGTGITNTLVVTFTNNTAFNDVDNIMLAPNSSTCNSILFFEEISVGTSTLSCLTPTLSLSSFTNVSCNGGSNGAATFTANGAPAFTYTWSPSGGNAASASGLSAGLYTCAITNSCGSTSSNTVIITQPSALVTSTAVTNVACNGGSGSGTITASGGTGAYTYLWSTGATSSSVSGLAGAYTSTVTDANNCTSIKSVVITQPSALSTSTAVTNVACNGGTGIGSIVASGGAGAYTYSWSTTATTSTISGLAGAYTATVTDANNCKSSKNITITQPSALVTSTAVTNVACNGGTGSGTITASGGTGGYTYLWSNGATTSTISGLAGAYTATVTDANNCTSVKSAVITQPSALVTSTAVTNVACNGGSGSATITASGGSGGYTYLWSNGATTSTISGLAGAYTATVTDANNCNSVKSAIITQPSALVTATAITNVACNGGNGSGTVTASGGTGSYTYLWSNAATTSTVSGLAGVYTATVTDANNCKSSKNVTITQPSALVTSTAVTNAACNGGNGSGTITASGGTGSYTYLWSNAATTSTVSGLAGAYTATVTDANNCTSVKSVIIAQPSALVTTTAVTNVACNGGSGSATITASGGTGSYTYLWSNGATTSTVSGLAGSYTATVTDANSCTSNKSAILTQPAALVTTTAVTNALCNGGNGSASLTVSGGTGAYTYVWSTGATTSTLSGLAGAYTATITDANNCTISKSVIITQPSILITNTFVSNALCNGGSGNGTITASGGTGAYTYSWSSGAAASVTSLVAGTYTVRVTDANNCSSTKSITLTQPSAILNNTSVSNALCYGGSGSATLTASGGTGSYTYLWSNSATTSSAASLPAGIQTATITDANSCSVIASIVVTQPSPLVLGTTATSAAICAGSAATLNVSGSGGTGSLTYTWTTGASGTSVVVNPSVTTIYTVNVSDANNCSQSQTVSLIVNSLPSATVPNYTICSGNSATISPSGANSYSITGSNFIVNPSITTSYSISASSSQGCNAAGVVVSTVFVNTSPTITVNNATICSGASAVVTPTGANTYSISGNNFMVSPSTTSTYSITGTATNGCISANAGISTIVVKASPTLAVNNATICSGNSVVITPTGANTYSISGNTFTVSPAATTNYSITGTSTNGCVSATVVTLFVNTTPTISLNSGAICPGNTYTLIPTGAATYTISGGLYVITPSLTSTYTLTGIASNGCPAGNTATATINVVNTLTVSVSGPTTVCNGSSVSLQANGASTYSWTNGTTGNTVALSPTVNTTYTVYGVSGTCSNTAVVSLSVLSTPSITASNATICSGSSFTINPSGADTYTIDGNNFVVAPLSDTSYSIIGTSVNGCQSPDTAIAMITVYTTPTLTINNPTICAGDTVVINASGADTYSISGGNFTVTPVTSTTYSVIGTSTNGCSSELVSYVTVNANPTITVSGNKTICIGETTTLTANGAASYSWNDGSTNNTSIESPTVTTSYIVSGLINGCGDSTLVVVNVNQLPVISAATSASTICVGETATLTVNGALSYTWSTSQSGNLITVSPTVAGSQNYSVSGTDANGCINTTNLVQNADNCTGLNKTTVENLIFNIYPNPNNGQFSLEAKENLLLTITNSVGQIVYSEKLTSEKTSIDIQHLANGIYFINATDGVKFHTSRFIKH